MAVPDSAVMGGGGMAVPFSAVNGGGVMAEHDSAVVGGGGIKEPDRAVSGGGVMAEHDDSAVFGGGGMTEGERTLLRSAESPFAPDSIDTMLRPTRPFCNYP